MNIIQKFYTKIKASFEKKKILDNMKQHLQLKIAEKIAE